MSRLSKVSTQLLLNETEGNFETPTTINEDGGLKQEALDRSELKIESTIENSEWHLYVLWDLVHMFIKEFKIPVLCNKW